MKKMVSTEGPRPLLILGRVANAADLALRRILRAKERGQALVVVDYEGNLASLLTDQNKANLHKGPLLWCDLANRRRPTALFRFKQSLGMKPALRLFLDSLVEYFVIPVSGNTQETVVDLAFRLAERGNIGLASLVYALRRPEIFHALQREPAIATELETLTGLLEWILGFPAVWCLSEGNNRIDLGHVLKLGGTAWLELPSAHFERIEHQVVSWMADAALLDALLSSTTSITGVQAKRHAPLLLYGFPNTCPLPMKAGEVEAKHVGLFGFSATHPLPAPAQHWLAADADCWIAGGIGELPKNAKTAWLTDAERTRLCELRPGQVWVRSGKAQTAVTVLVRAFDRVGTPAQAMRRQAQKILRLTPVKQFSAALTSNKIEAPQYTDIYRKLATKNALYLGWIRVKAHNQHSFGHDRITIQQFGTALDVELTKLALELAEGRYRSRPLRTARIPKADGDVRILRIACVRDRVVQAACLYLIEPIFDVRFSHMSFAYRPGRGAHHAIAVVRSAIRSGKQWAVTADIRKCFDTIDHEIVLRLVGDVIGDRDLVGLIRNWLVADVIDFMDVIPSELGVPQGEAISPLLANIYLDPMDKEFEKVGLTFVRYADDYVVLCDTEAEAQAALRLMSEFLQGVLRMALKPAKTQYCRVEDGIGFLGFQIGSTDVAIPEAKMAQTIEKIGESIEVIARIAAKPMEKYQAVEKMNSLVRGFRNYFLIDSSPSVLLQLSALDVAVEAIATEKFAVGHCRDTAWDAREKFHPRLESAEHQSRTAAEVAVLTGEYPSDRPPSSDEDSSGNEAAHRLAVVSAPVGGSTPVRSANPEAEEQMQNSDVLTIDGRLHVLTSGCFVTVNGDDLVVRRRKKVEIFRMPIADLTLVYLEGKGIALSADLTMRLCEQDIPVVFAPLVGIPAAIAQPVESARSHVRQQQVLRKNDPDILMIGLKMLGAKVGNQAAVLKYFARYRKRTNEATYHALTRAADDIRSIADTLDSLDPARVSVRAVSMGHEGQAAAKYWSSFASLTPDAFAFPGRHTRHATDPINSAINYVYGMLYGEVWRAVIRAGLDPYFGIIHGTERDQGSLVFDLIEEYRAPFGDRVVLGLLGRGFRLELDKEGLIRARCRQKLVEAFHKQWRRTLRWCGKLRAPSEILEVQVTSLKNAFLGKGEYRPFRFRW